MITEVGTVFRTARERSLSITTQPRDFQGTSALRRLHGDRGLGAAASVVSTVTGEAVALVDSTAAAVEVFLVVVVGIVAAEGSEALVVGEEVGVAVISVDFAAVAVSVAVVSAGGVRSECRVTRVECRGTNGVRLLLTSTPDTRSFRNSNFADAPGLSQPCGRSHREQAVGVRYDSLSAPQKSLQVRKSCKLRREGPGFSALALM